ncbi:MAG: AraC family transcriptional regulator [Parvularculaceae bacterium]
MNPLRIALWYVERRLGETISLDEVAAASGISRRHLARAFALHAGLPVIAYARARRLSEAAKALQSEDCSVLTVALAFGYGSHEAFTRAFTDHFRISPSKARNDEIFKQLKLQEAISMSAEPAEFLASPEIVKGERRRIVGLKEHYRCGRYGGIPEQWSRLAAHPVANSIARGDGVSYGVCFNFTQNGDMDYLCGFEADSSAAPGADLSAVDLEPGEYAVFAHRGHVSSIGETWRAIYAHGLAALSRKPKMAPQYERMDHCFNPVTGSGVIEIWIPLSPED